MPLTSMPSTILVPTPAKVDVPLNMLLAKLSMNIAKSIAGDDEGGDGGKNDSSCSSPNGSTCPKD